VLFCKDYWNVTSVCSLNYGKYWHLKIKCSIRGVRYDDFWSWTIKMSDDLLLKKYRSIVLQHTFYQLQFWRLRLYIVYNTTYSGRVTLTGHCTYSRSQKYIICIQALSVKRLIRTLVWRLLFLSAYTRSTRTKTLSNSAWLLN